MFLSKASNGYFYLYFKDETGKRKKVSTRCKRKGDALRFLQTFRTQRIPKPKETRLSDFMKDFLAYASSTFAPRTLSIYRQAFKRFLPFVGDCLLSGLTCKHLDDYKVLRLATISPITCNIELRHLKAAFRTAVRWKLLAEHPFAEVQQCRVPEKSPVFFDKRDFERLLILIQEQWLKEVIVFAALTGMRRGEIFNLKWSEVDMGRKLMYIQTDANFKTKYGKKRVMPMNEVVYNILMSRRGRNLSEFVFTRKGRKVRDDWAGHLLKRYVRQAQLDDRLHFHSLRHSFASWLAADGISIYTISKLLGHSSVQTTQNYYAHLQPELLHDTVNRINIQLN
jgi:integrase